MTSKTLTMAPAQVIASGPALDSNISAAQYSCDLVIAQKQSSINTYLQRMLHSSIWQDAAPLNNICYGIDKSSNLFELDYDALVESGADPFSIPNDTKLNDERIKRLQSFNFLIAFRAQIGIPLKTITRDKLPQVPDIVVLNGAGSATIRYFSDRFESMPES